MKRKRWVRLIFILLPCLLILVYVFRPTPMPNSHNIQKAIRELIPPLEIIFRYFDFNEQNALAKWEEKMFTGRVAYWIDFENSGGFVHSKSENSASAIFYRIKFNIRDYPYLSWKWRIGRFPNKSHTQEPKKRDDFAARIYVVFVSRFFTSFRCVEYVWDESLPEGTALKSPYSNRIKQLVVQSGPVRGDEWVKEKQNVFDDYQKLFGEPPKMKVAAIALMTDSEGTGGEAEGFFDDIQIGKES